METEEEQVLSEITDCKSSNSNEMNIENFSEDIQSNQQKSNESSSPKRTAISVSPILNTNKLPGEIEHSTLVFTKDYETKNLNSETTGTNDLSRETDHLSPGDSAAEVVAERKHRSRQILDDSDSENESIEKCEAQDKASNIDPKENIITNTKKHKRIAVFDSDSESEIIKITPHNKSFNDEISFNKDNGEESIDPEENIIKDTKTRKRIAVFDSDSESEIIKILSHNKSFNAEISVNKENGDESPVLCATNSKGNVEPETDKPIQKSKLAMLCDSDSEDDSVIQNALNNSDDEILKGTQDLQETKSRRSTIPKGRNKSEKSKRKNSKQKDLIEDIPKKMTPKEAAELRKEIQSESQRMLREKNVSLPYHKPKSHSLRDFLARRPKLAVLGIARAPPSVAIKMSTEQLEIISKKLEERRKEVKDFYKSESESSESDENDSEYVPPTIEENELANKNSDTEMNDQQFKNYGNSHTETNTLDNMNKEGILETPANKEKQPEIVDFEMVEKGTNYVLTQNAGVEAARDTTDKIDNGCIFETMDELTRKSLGESKEHNENEAQLKDDAPKSTESIDPVIINLQENVNHVDSDTPVIFTSEEKESFTEESQTNSPMDIDQTPEMNNFEEKTDLNPDEIQLQASTVTHTKELDPITSESYDFHLEDESTEKIDASGDSIETENISTEAQLEKADEVPRKQTSEEEKLKQPQFNYTDLDKEIENFGNSKEISEEENQNKLPPAPVKSKLELLREQLANDKPRLSGGPDEVIDLESGVAKPAEVVQLMERFAKHVSAKKHQSKHKVKLSIVTVESGGDIHKEELAVNVDSDDEAVTTEEKPGAKLHKLKEELQKQMEQKKAKLWQQKAARGFRGGPENTEDVEGGEKDILDYDDEEEAEMTDEEFTDEEEDDDIKLMDKPQKKSAFLDQEAEVSDDEEAGEALKDGYEDNVPDDEENEEETEVNDHSESDNEEEENEDDKDSSVSNEPENDDSNMSEQPLVEATEEKKRVLKRIVKPMDDSDEEDLFNESILQKSTTNVHLDSTVTADEDDIPPHQPRQLQTPIRPAVSQTKSISDFLTPISFITSIQNLTSASKSIKEGPIISPFKMPTDIHSPDKAAKILPQKKLFTDSEVWDSQGSLDVSPSQTQESSSDLKHDDDTISMQTSQMEPSDEPPNTQDLLGICSGEFTGVTQLEPTENTKELIDFASTQTSELKCLGQDDMIISQLLDEEELEIFKKKFESPVNQVSQRSIIGEAQEITGGGVIDSDDDEEGEIKQKKKKNQKRIQFSDDESSEEEEEEIDLQDRDEIDDEEIDNVGYDSEENEIDLNAEGKKQEKLKLADFLEAEAELSESEWGSEDEDEKDLDQMEFEVGDKDKFDEEKVKSDLEKIHMRRMLDDDTREVKLLQELLLEDGEMHGTGRQRQFKWKNIDSTNDNEGEEKKDDDDIYLDEEESEEQWRKQRHEREMFFKQQQLKSQSMDSEEDLLCTSHLLKIGQKFLQRSLSHHNSQNSTPTEKTKTDPDSPFQNTIFSLQNKRGSFLNRSDQVLQRVAEYTRVSTDVNVGGSRKTTKHFLFQSSSATEVSIASVQSKKRKASEGTPNVLKKLRLNTNLSPAFKKKLDKPERAKKLFNF